MARLSTGLAGLDAKFGGGVPPGTVHILIGEPMNAFELFGQHFAAAVQAEGATSHYLVAGSNQADIEAGLTRVGGDLKTINVRLLPKSGKWTFPAIGDADRLVLDGYSAYSEAVGQEEALKTLEGWKAKVRKGGGNILITAVEGLHHKEELMRLKQWADGVFELGFDRQGFGLYPFLKVTKMRGVPDAARLLLLKESDDGLFVESTRRVF